MKKSIKIPNILLLLLLGTRIFAQDPFNPGADPGGGVAPINDFIIPMLLVGFVLGYRLLVAKDDLTQNN